MNSAQRSSKRSTKKQKARVDPFEDLPREIDAILSRPVEKFERILGIGIRAALVQNWDIAKFMADFVIARAPHHSGDLAAAVILRGYIFDREGFPELSKKTFISLLRGDV
jgi:hypothetical protein